MTTEDFGSDRLQPDGGETGARSVDDTEHCPACGLEADAMGVLDTGETIYLHDSRYCLHDPADTGFLGPAVDQLEAHKEADS